ncbi:MAG: hypothetical protein RL160_1605 [Bacteroidota bacterium]|jgi:hypothetical protein
MKNRIILTLLGVSTYLFATTSANAQMSIALNPMAKSWTLNGTVFTAKSKTTEILSALGGANRQLSNPNRTQYVFDSLGLVVETDADGNNSIRVFLGNAIRASEPVKPYTGTLLIADAQITAALSIAEVKAKTPAVTWEDLMGKGLIYAGKGVMLMVDTRSGKVNDVGFGLKK